MATPTTKIKIEKTGEMVTYKKINKTENYLVNNKLVRVYAWSLNDEENGEYDGDTEIDGEDDEMLTEDEHEALADELDTLTHEEVGFKTEVNFD